MDPLALRPRLCPEPAAIPTKPLLGAGTLAWPEKLLPYATMDPLALSPRLSKRLAATPMKPLLGEGTLV